MTGMTQAYTFDALKQDVAAGRIDTFIPKAHAPTLFARYGNMLPVGFALLLLALAIPFRRRGR